MKLIIAIILLIIAILGGCGICTMLENKGMTKSERKYLRIGWAMAFISSALIVIACTLIVF